MRKKKKGFEMEDGRKLQGEKLIEHLVSSNQNLDNFTKKGGRRQSLKHRSRDKKVDSVQHLN